MSSNPPETAAPRCVFCERISNREYDILWTDAVAFEPLNPVTPGHMLIVSRLHVESAAADPWVAEKVMRWAACYADLVGDCNIITSVGPAATQTIKHLHIHVVPRREGDGLPLPWTPQQEAEKSA